jgi:CMP-N,N'-diacetyllegionaminic acid synthase
MPHESDCYILGLIPARGGSKGIPRKNLRPLAGRPLIEYACQAALESRRLTRTIVSTDSPEIAEAAAAAGVEVPFLRPAALAQDRSTSGEVVGHALDWLREHEGREPDVVVLLQPTAPLRQARHIDESIDLLLRSEADSVVSVAAVPAHYHPRWQFEVIDGQLQIFTGEPLDKLVPRRQDLPVTYVRNGAIYAFFRQTWRRCQSFYGTRCLAYVMPEELSVNLDGPEDWALAEAALARKAAAA